MARSLLEILNEANPNKLASAAQSARLGSLLALSPRFVRGAVASNVLSLPDAAKALCLLYVRSVAATSTTGRFAIDENGGTPATGNAAVNPTGDVLFAAADGVTEAEAVYVKAEGDVIEETVAVASDSGTLLASRKGLLLLEAEILAGTDPGVLTVVERGATPGDNEAALSDLGTTVAFNAADGATSARIKYIAEPGEGTAKPALVPELDDVDELF